jgi:hypothetical protein
MCVLQERSEEVRENARTATRAALRDADHIPAEGVDLLLDEVYDTPTNIQLEQAEQIRRHLADPSNIYHV